MTGPPSADITGILLAAGSSTRFGGDKQLALLDGVAMLRHAAALLVQAELAGVIVVVRTDVPAHRAALHGLPVRIVENANAASGIASSLAAGIHAAEDAAAALVMVCDQPAVTADHLRALVSRWRSGDADIVASRYADAIGVPALFSAAYFPALVALHGDRGAGQLLAQHRDRIATLPLDSGAFDIDTADDLVRFRQQRGQ